MSEQSKTTPPSAWGASFWKTLDICERKHYYTYVLGLEPAGVTKPPALECGTVFHENREARLLPILQPHAPTSYEDTKIRRHEVDWRRWLKLAGLSDEKLERHFAKYNTYRQALPPAWKEFPVETGVWLDEEYEQYWSGNGAREDEVDTLLQQFTVEGVERSIILEDEAMLARLGLLLPLTAKYDTIVRLDGRSDRAYASLEHKTVGRAAQFDKYKRDIQVDTQLICWNATHGPEEQMCGVIIDEANKAQKPTRRFRREMFTRTPQQIERFLKNMRIRQERYLTVVEAARELEDGGTSEFEIAEAWQMRETMCYNYGECPFVKLCTHGRDALVMYNIKGPEHYEDPEEKEVE